MFADILRLQSVAKWDESQHPRDAEGQFITVGGRQIMVVKPQRAASDTLVPLSVHPFDQRFSKDAGFYLGPGGGKNAIGNRYERFGEFIAQNDSIESPEVYIGPDGRVGFTNGRHRYAWLRDQGLATIPVAMDRDSVRNAKKFGYLSAKKFDEPKYSYGNTQIAVSPHSSAALVLNMTRDRIQDSHLMAAGKDVDPNHVTVRYGLLNDDLDGLRSFIARQMPFEAQLGMVELFPASEHSDGAVPVVARIYAPELHAIEAEIGKYADFKDKSFPDYKPHCTLAYCTPEDASAYGDLFLYGSFLVQSITISHQSGVQETIPFGMTQKKEWNPALHPRNPRGSSEGGEFTSGPRDAMESLLNGEKVSIDPGDVRRLLEMSSEQMEEPNLMNLHVDGMRIFDRDGLNIERDDMPQIPKEHRDRFVAWMKEQGVTATLESVSPLDLLPTQNSVSARNVGEKIKKYERDKHRPFFPVLVSKESRVVDGHHHWGMMAALAIDVPDIKMPILRFNVGINKALALAQTYMNIHHLKRKSESGETVKFDESKHPRDKEGQFSSGVGAFNPSLVADASAVPYKSREKLIEMPIADFLAVAEPGVSADKTALVNAILDQGGAFDALPHLQYQLKDGQAVVIGHEGRHRARALLNRGHTTMPVILRGDIRWSEQQDPKAFDYQKVWPEQLQSQQGKGAIAFPVSRAQATEQYRVKKADPVTGRYVTPFVSFDKQGDDALRMIASLNSSRLATWGFTAEAEVLGMARYKLTAVLDGRTSKFCRFINGRVFEVSDARRKVIEALNVQDPEDLRTVQPWPKQTKAAMEEYAQMSNEEFVERGWHIPPYHPYCRTLLRAISSSVGDAMEPVETLPEGVETFQAVTADDLKELGIDATPEEVAQWNEVMGMTPVELFTKLTSMTPQEVMTDGVGANPINFDSNGIGIKARGENTNGVEFKLGALLDPFTNIFYLNQADLTAGTPKAELGFLKNLFTELINTGTQTTATSLAVGVAGNAAYFAKMGFLPDDLDWDVLRNDALMEIESGPLKTVVESLAPEDQLLVTQLLQDQSASSLSALVELPFFYEGKSIGEYILENAGGTWALDLTDQTLVDQARAYLS